MEDPLIEFQGNVSKIYNNGTEALHNINLKVDKGEFVLLSVPPAPEKVLF